MILEAVFIIIGVLAAFVAVLASSFVKPSEKQKYSFFTAICAFFYFTISFMNIYSDSVDQYILYQKFIFAAGLYTMLGFGFAISYMFNIPYSNRVKLLITFGVTLFVVAFSVFTNAEPWVRSIEMVQDKNCALYQFIVHGSWLYYLLNILSVLGLASWVIYVVIKSSKNKGREFKLFRAILCFALIPLFIWILTALKVIPFLIADKILFVIILLVVMHFEIFYTLKFDPKKYLEPVSDSTSFGIILLDNKKRFIYANKSAKEYIEVLNTDNKDAITAFINVNLIEENTFYNGIDKFSLRMEVISDDNNPRIGYSLWLIKENKVVEEKETQN